MLTPSSNTVLEPVTGKILSAFPGTSVHFSRFKVTEIALDKKALDQFDSTTMLAAAEQLADAKVNAISWNGTSASWLGLQSDRDLVAQIEKRTGIKASTCVLSLMDVLRSLKASRIGLVTPYTDDVQQKIISNFAAANIECPKEIHFNIRDNFQFGMVPPTQVSDSIREVADAGIDAVVVLCTNLNGVEHAAEIERQSGVPVLDSVALTVWGALKRIDHPTKALEAWGPALAAA